ncbi:MAG: fumarylacetoacetate hydrolase family protein [bacterium]|jgi:2-keto-4-pentenoate hydratase/2-oxohepta-3-ene-1,7-dioic acid hydratase in catechol pathway
MKLITFTYDGTTRIGVVKDDAVVDLSTAAPDLPREMVAFLEAGDAALDAARAASDAVSTTLALADVHLESPILRPPKILAVGLNYADHIAETGMDTPKHPMIFNKQSTSAHPPGDPFHAPRVSDKIDYEGELGVVIGKRCRHVPKERAAEVIAGYTVVNDATVRDWQMRVPTMTMGKSFDTHCPMGPWLMTADEVSDPHSLELKTWVNGELRQHSNTKHLIFNCFDLVEHLSTAFTLEPGDVIATGTPSGVGIGFKPRKFLVAGDVVRIAIDGIGEIENAVVTEPPETIYIG